MGHDALFPTTKSNCGWPPRGDDIRTAITLAAPPTRLVRVRFDPALLGILLVTILGSSQGSPLTDRESAPLNQQQRSATSATVPLGRTAEILEAERGEAIERRKHGSMVNVVGPHAQ